MEKENIIVENSKNVKNEVETLIDGQMSGEKNNKIVFILMVVIPLIISILSFAIFANYATSAKIHSVTINSLQEKQNTVLAISAVSATIAAGASLALGDRANAVSNKLLDLTGYFVIILCAIMLEKYLVTIMGFLSFKILIPIAGILFSFFTIFNKTLLRKYALKIFVFAVVSFFIIPLSVSISTLIENTYNEANLQQVLNNGNNLNEELNNEIADIDNNVVVEETVKEITNNNVNNENAKNEEKEKVSFFSKAVGMVTDFKDKITEVPSAVVEVVTDNVNKLKDRANQLINKLSSYLNRMIETIAVMLVTTCVIPVLVIVFFFWLVEKIFSVELKIDPKQIPKLSNARNAKIA